MDYNVEFKITLPDELLETFGIDEDTPFEAYFEDGAIKVRILDEDELKMYGYDEDDDEDNLTASEKVHRRTNGTRNLCGQQCSLRLPTCE